MEWITTIGGLFLGGGGWGSFAAILAAGVLIFILYKMYKKSVQKKAENDTKEKSVEDEYKQFKKNKEQEKQISEDEKKNEEAYNNAKENP